MNSSVCRVPQRAWESRIWEVTKRRNFSVVQVRHLTVSRKREDGDGRERVLILGSGWAGYTLARRLDPKKFHAIIISPRSYFVFTPLLASTAVGTLEFRTALEPIRSKRTPSGFIQGWADSIDLFNRRVMVEEAVDDPRLGLAPTGQRRVALSTGERVLANKGRVFGVDYDKLVIAVGCYSQTFGIPGVRDHALFLKDVGDARRIRKRILACFEKAALPTSSDELKKYLLNFAIVGGGPTGIEFAAELHDLINQDLSRLYSDLTQFVNITVYDVAPTVLPMFDKTLGEYAIKHFRREGITVKTSHHIQSLRKGLPSSESGQYNTGDEEFCMTLDVKEEGEVGIGMVVWSTGLMKNPFIRETVNKAQILAPTDAQPFGIESDEIVDTNWYLKHDEKTGSLLTDEHLRVIMQPKEPREAKGKSVHIDIRAVMKDVYALGDCAIIENTPMPATAQVASQKADWLGKMLNKGGPEPGKGFQFRNLGIMAYLGNWKAILQPESGANLSGRSAFLVWRGAYLTKSVSWRNKLLIPIYWFLNWFGRDVSRF